jgi:putative ABC transport system ATP-binding protein
MAIEAHGVTRGFGVGSSRVEVLRGVEFQAAYDEVTFLVGPSGCGKTTFISILGGILSADGGNVEVLGQRIDRMGQGQLADFRLSSIGFIFQQFNLIPALTVLENASIPLIAQGVQERVAHARTSELLERLGIADQRHKMPTQLSGGQQQRVAIARALVHEPRLVICDEPTASLDGATGLAVMELMRSIARHEDRALLIVTHDDRIYHFADRIVHMTDGLISHVEDRHA